jgi:aminoglycoside/choline kinase family phosphotransferase
MLSARYPQHLPHVLAVDTDRNWMLLGDLGDQTFCGVDEVARWEEALRRFAQIQIDLSSEIDHLLAMGCPDQRLSTLEAGLCSLLAPTRHW